MKKNIFTFIFFMVSVYSFSQKIENIFVDNLYKVETGIYRSAQPNKKGMIYLDSLGIKTILNLRHTKNDNCKATNTNLILEKVSINTWKISEQDIIDALKIIKYSEKPILVHCLHGSDRTGAIIAAYRIIFQNWTKKQAINEMLKNEYGFHINSFKHIIKLIENLNIDNVKKQLQN